MFAVFQSFRFVLTVHIWPTLNIVLFIYCITSSYDFSFKSLIKTFIVSVEHPIKRIITFYTVFKISYKRIKREKKGASSSTWTGTCSQNKNKTFSNYLCSSMHTSLSCNSITWSNEWRKYKEKYFVKRDVLVNQYCGQPIPTSDIVPKY